MIIFTTAYECFMRTLACTYTEYAHKYWLMIYITLLEDVKKLNSLYCCDLKVFLSQTMKNM